MKIMISNKTTGRSQSASGQSPAQDFLTVLTLLVLSLHDGEHEHPFKKLGLDKTFDEALAGCEPLVRKWGFFSALSSAVKQFRARGNRFDEELSYDLATAMNKAKAKIKADIDNVNPAQITYIDKCRTYFKQDSDPSWKYVINNVHRLRQPLLSAQFAGHVETAAKPSNGVKIDLARMKAIARIFTETLRKEDGEPASKARNETVLTSIEVGLFRESDPGLWKEYMGLSKALMDKGKLELRKYILATGKDMIPVSEAAKYLTALGCNHMPIGFKGYVDDESVFYTQARHKIAGPIVGTVVMNPNYDPKQDNAFVCFSVGKNVNREVARWRTLNFNHKNQLKKFEVVKTAATDMRAFRKKWYADMKSDDAKKRVIAALVETAHTTLARVGGKDNESKGEPTYGLTTLLVQHVKIDSRGAHFNYAGKKGTEQPATLFYIDPVTRKPDPVAKLAIGIIKECMQGKARSDLLFSDPITDKEITAGDANRYLKTLGIPSGFTMHKFRHTAATKMFYEIIPTCPFKKGAKETTASAVWKWYTSALMPIGIALHHKTGDKDTAVTAIGAYVSLEAQRKFFKDLGLHEPTQLAKKRAK